MQQREKQIYSKTAPHNFYNHLNYHLKKIQPFKNKVKRTVAQQMKNYIKTQKVSTINNNKKHINKIVNRTQQPDSINQEHITQNIAQVSSQIKIYQTPGSTRQNVFQRGNSESKLKKIQIAQRGKSLKYWKTQKNEPKIFTHIRGFFNTFLSQNDGCKCGPYCQCKQVLINWIAVPEDLIYKNYSRLLQITNKQNLTRRQNQSHTQYSQSASKYIKEKDQYDSNDDFDDKGYEKQKLKHKLQIQKDVIRTQTHCEIFHRKQTQQKLGRILMCYTVQDPEVGYVQSMNIVASGVLYHVRDEAKTYAICRKLFHQIRRIYLHNFEECYKHINVLIAQVQMQINDLFVHFQQIGLQLKIILFPWILSLLCVLVPLDELHLIYIGFVKKGWIFIYKTILALFVYYKDILKHMEQAGDVMVFLSVSNQDREKQNIDWADIIKYGQNIQIYSQAKQK